MIKKPFAIKCHLKSFIQMCRTPTETGSLGFPLHPHCPLSLSKEAAEVIPSRLVVLLIQMRIVSSFICHLSLSVSKLFPDVRLRKHTFALSLSCCQANSCAGCRNSVGGVVLLDQAWTRACTTERGSFNSISTSGICASPGILTYSVLARHSLRGATAACHFNPTSSLPAWFMPPF